MNIWTVFFLVVSMVVLAAPLVLASGSAGRGRNIPSRNDPGNQAMEDDELELDFASGRLAREDYEEMSGRTEKRLSVPGESSGGDHEHLPEG